MDDFFNDLRRDQYKEWAKRQESQYGKNLGPWQRVKNFGNELVLDMVDPSTPIIDPDQSREELLKEYQRSRFNKTQPSSAWRALSIHGILPGESVPKKRP